MAEKDFDGEDFVFPDEQNVTPVGTETKIELDIEGNDIDIEMQYHGRKRF